MNKAFTMIELIFTIVIIGVLAAIAIPKLATTRNDAEGARIVNSLATCINDAGNSYMKDESFNGITQPNDPDETVACKEANKCFVFVEMDTNGSLQVGNSSTTIQKCIAAQRIAIKNFLTATHVINF